MHDGGGMYAPRIVGSEAATVYAGIRAWPPTIAASDLSCAGKAITTFDDRQANPASSVEGENTFSLIGNRCGLVLHRWLKVLRRDVRAAQHQGERPVQRSVLYGRPYNLKEQCPGDSSAPGLAVQSRLNPRDTFIRECGKCLQLTSTKVPSLTAINPNSHPKILPPSREYSTGCHSLSCVR